MDNILIIFAKYPAPGKVKTRLAKDLGEIKAAELYALFVQTIIKRIKSEKYQTIVFYSPFNKRQDFKKWLGKNIVLMPQKGKSLGRRLKIAFAKIFDQGAQNVIAIGTDSPLIDSDTILSAFKKLKNNDCVIGPSQDGGYYLIGLKTLQNKLFSTHIKWGTNTVFKQTLKVIKKLNLKFFQLKEQFDVDTSNDLTLLKTSLSNINSQEKHLFALKRTIENID